MNLLWIPVEILVNVLESLDDWKDVLNCMEVGVLWKGVTRLICFDHDY
jgi:hypothetical protein